MQSFCQVCSIFVHIWVFWVNLKVDMLKHRLRGKTCSFKHQKPVHKQRFVNCSKKKSTSKHTWWSLVGTALKLSLWVLPAQKALLVSTGPEAPCGITSELYNVVLLNTGCTTSYREWKVKCGSFKAAISHSIQGYKVMLFTTNHSSTRTEAWLRLCRVPHLTFELPMKKATITFWVCFHGDGSCGTKRFNTSKTIKHSAAAVNTAAPFWSLQIKEALKSWFLFLRQKHLALVSWLHLLQEICLQLKIFFFLEWIKGTVRSFSGSLKKLQDDDVIN